MIDQLEAIWNQLLDITAVFVTPNWNDPISWLPLLLLVGVVGPLLTIVVLGWLWYGIRKPRPKASFADPRRPAEIGPDGTPAFPTGEPYCIRDRIVFEPGATRCDLCGDPLQVSCPKCGLARSAAVDTCGNCGLTFRISAAPRALKPAGPPPGGRAVA